MNMAEDHPAPTGAMERLIPTETNPSCTSLSHCYRMTYSRSRIRSVDRRLSRRRSAVRVSHIHGRELQAARGVRELAALSSSRDEGKDVGAVEEAQVLVSR